jgi:hypothetical protein
MILSENRFTVFRIMFRADRQRRCAENEATCAHLARYHMAMADDQVFRSRRASSASRATFSAAEARGKVIDQEGREIPRERLGSSFGGVHFDFRQFGASPFAPLTREQRLKRLEAIAKLLDVAFVLPGTNIRYGIDGIIGLIPVVGDIIATGLSLWLVREARALGAPWHVTARMLGNVAFQGVVGMVPIAGDAIDVLFRANMRNARLLRTWLDRQPR